MKLFLPLLLSAGLLLVQCKKHDPTPLEQLPPATQTGANTFGCLLNGEAWTPSGSFGVPNYRVTYDPGYAGGSLGIRAYRYIGDTSYYQYINLGGDRIDHPGDYPLVLNGDRSVSFTDRSLPSSCAEYYDPPKLTYRTGTLTITRLDLQQGIIAGTFSFTLYQPGCDSIRVTQGRFDKKL